MSPPFFKEASEDTHNVKLVAALEGTVCRDGNDHAVVGWGAPTARRSTKLTATIPRQFAVSVDFPSLLDVVRLLVTDTESVRLVSRGNLVRPIIYLRGDD